MDKTYMVAGIVRLVDCSQEGSSCDRGVGFGEIFHNTDGAKEEFVVADLQ
jgi:hypothetical protein